MALWSQEWKKLKIWFAQMPQEADHIDMMVEEAISKPASNKHDFDELTADFKNIPVFDPVTTAQHASREGRVTEEELKKSVPLMTN